MSKQTPSIDIATISLQISPICLGCFEVFTSENDLMNHKIRCDKYYALDTTDNKIHEYCYEQSKNGKVIIVNKELGIDFNYVKQNKYKCWFATEPKEFMNGLMEMNPKLKVIYENETITILSDCIDKIDMSLFSL